MCLCVHAFVCAHVQGLGMERVSGLLGAKPWDEAESQGSHMVEIFSEATAEGCICGSGHVLSILSESPVTSGMTGRGQGRGPQPCEWPEQQHSLVLGASPPHPGGSGGELSGLQGGP